MTVELVALAAVAGACAAAVLFAMPRFGSRLIPLDQPNARSLHDRPVPRAGGIAVLVGGAISLGFGTSQLWLPMSLAACLAVVSFVDDLRGIPTAARLLAHVACAALLVWHVLSPMHATQLAVLIVAVVWITNLYNFMDGSDGLAGGMAVVGFGTYAVAAYLTGHAALGALSLALATASAIFLMHNFHPARVFLGDVGSIPLGFLAAALGIVGWRDDVWPLWFPVLVFGPFIGDATVTLIKRLIRGDRVWQAHRDHYYQRMVRMGLGHRITAYVAYAAMLVCAVAALLGRQKSPEIQALAFGTASAILALAAVWVDLRWARFYRAQGIST